MTLGLEIEILVFTALQRMDQFIPTGPGAAPASVGVFLGKLWAHGEVTSKGPLATNSKKNLVGRERSSRAQTQEAGLPHPCRPPPPSTCPNPCSPGESSYGKPAGRSCSASVYLGLLPFPYSLDKLRAPQSQRQTYRYTYTYVRGKAYIITQR